EAGEKELKKGKAELELRKKELEEGEKELTVARKTLDNSKEELGKEKSKLKDAKIKAENEFAIGRKELEDTKEEQEKGKEGYEKAEKETEEELKEAREKIAEGEEEIKGIKEPKWYVIKRNQTLDFIDYEMAADRIDAIAKVFPVFFFLIAALVSFTTMTRMVDEQRIYIGTLKALGYSKIAIASKYIIYAGLASIGG